MVPEITAEELSAALDSVVGELLDVSGIIGAPVDAFRVAESLGLDIAWDRSQEGRARLVSLGRVTAAGSIFLRPEPRIERRQWAVAHEIGEHVAHRAFERLGVDPSETFESAREAVANGIAARLLLPTAWLLQEGPQLNWDLTALKSRYATASHELIARRMLDFEAPIIITIFDETRITLRRCNTGVQPPPLSVVEKNCWRRTRQQGAPQENGDAGLAVRCWAVHEPDWKREIARTELPEFGV